MAEPEEPVYWLVEDLIPEGFTVLGSAPKIGKTYMCFNLALAAARGGLFLGAYKVDQCEVLYVDKDQGRKKSRKRMRDLLWSADPGARIPPGIHFAFDWPRLDEGGLEGFDRYLSDHRSCKAVFIDVLQKVKPKARQGQGNVYDVDYDGWGPLQKLANDHGVAVIGVHHDNKNPEGDAVDKFSGSRGLVAVADGLIFLSRKRGQQDGMMFATGREIEDRNDRIRFDHYSRSWVLTEGAPEGMPT